METVKYCSLSQITNALFLADGTSAITKSQLPFDSIAFQKAHLFTPTADAALSQAQIS
ncbi:hypothetical protein [Hymenobacter terrenus]|uniref:hypothetical protein n=1 Tax=Hymenobacter terrenus TaxID=1629124 RepID=UPI0012E00E06|nr:hypothetical protein [Hymenobacter terrenus]